MEENKINDQEDQKESVIEHKVIGISIGMTNECEVLDIYIEDIELG